MHAFGKWMITEASSSTEAGGTGVMWCYATLHYTTVYSTKLLQDEEASAMWALSPLHVSFGLVATAKVLVEAKLVVMG